MPIGVEKEREQESEREGRDLQMGMREEEVGRSLGGISERKRGSYAWEGTEVEERAERNRAPSDITGGEADNIWQL